MSKPVIVPATFTSFRLLSDGGVSIGFSTQELSDEEKLLLGSFHRKFGQVAFRENELAPEDIPAEDAEFEGKTPSQRLRGRMYVYYAQTLKKNPAGFDAWYAAKMDKIGQQFLEKVEKRP